MLLSHHCWASLRRKSDDGPRMRPWQNKCAMNEVPFVATKIGNMTPGLKMDILLTRVDMEHSSVGVKIFIQNCVIN